MVRHLDEWNRLAGPDKKEKKEAFQNKKKFDDYTLNEVQWNENDLKVANKNASTTFFMETKVDYPYSRLGIKK